MNRKTDSIQGNLVRGLIQGASRTAGRSVGMAALVCLSLPALANSPAQDRAFIQSAYQKMDQAAARKDVVGCIAFMRPDFKQYEKDSRKPPHGKEETRQEMTQILARVTQVTAHTTITHIGFSKAGATVDTRSESAITLMAGGKKREIKGSDTSRDLWVRGGSGWLLKTSRTLSSLP